MDDLLALLRLQLEWGADEAIELEPVDRLRRAESQSARAKPQVAVVADPAQEIPAQEIPAQEIPAQEIPAQEIPAQASPAQETPVKGASVRGTPAERAAILASQAMDLEALRAVVAAFDGCALRDTASNLVFAEGEAASGTLIIGEPPGRDEDRAGHPIAGAEGHLLDQMLASIGLTRDALLLAPLVPWRPPGGRPASPNEIAACLPFLHRLIVLSAARRILLFGSSPARALLPPGQGRRREPRLRIDVSVPGTAAKLPVLALPGLAEMLKTPPLRRDAWAGLRLLRRTLDSIPTRT